MNPSHVLSSHFLKISLIFSHLRPGEPSGLLPSGFPPHLVGISLLSHVCYVLFPSPLWLCHSDIIWRGIQGMKFRITQLPQASYPLIPLRSKYIFSTLFSNTLPQCGRPSFTPIQNDRKNYEMITSIPWILCAANVFEDAVLYEYFMSCPYAIRWASQTCLAARISTGEKSK